MRVFHSTKQQPKHLFHWLLAFCIIVGASLYLLNIYFNRPPEVISQEEDVADSNSESEEISQGPVLAGDYKEGFYTFLIVGVDAEGSLTDTIMVAALDTVNSQLNVVSVPRDTQVDVARNPKKINSAYAVGGVEQLKAEIKSLLGFKPHYYLVVGLEAFKELVDVIGGVEFYVPQDMKRKDSDPRLNIDLKQGHQLLDGDKALQLVRFRGYPNADIGRIETQQQFLLALADELLAISNIPKIPELLRIFEQQVETDLSFRDMQWFARKVMDLQVETDISIQTLPIAGFGNYKGHNYVYLSKEELLTLVNEALNPFKHSITANDVNIIRLQDGLTMQP